jgi:predicted DCC family thiol-disulfide oxidoreductase YuxK
LVEKDAAYIKSTAVLSIAAKLSIPWPLLGALGMQFPPVLNDFVYDQIASNRYKIFGKTMSCRLGDERFNERFISE